MLIFCAIMSLFAFEIDAHNRHQFQVAVTNNSAVVQRIEPVVSSCSCFRTSTIPKSEILPFHACPLLLDFNPIGLEGNVSKNIKVTWSPSGNQVSLPIGAHVRVRCDLRPRDVAFGVVREDQSTLMKRTVALYGYVLTNAVQARITGVAAPDNPVFDVRANKDGRALDVALSSEFFNRSEAKTGLFAETWRVEITDPEIPSQKLFLEVVTDVPGMERINVPIRVEPPV